MFKPKKHKNLHVKNHPFWHIDLRQFSFIPNASIPWIIWSIVGFYYLYEIILRVLPSTMRLELISQFQINAAQFGLFTSFYYLSYVIMQIPTGLIVDRYSIRKTLLTACLFCILGLFLIHHTDQFLIAGIGRFIIGFGSAFAYVYTLKVATIWLPKKHFGLAICIADSLGMIGAIFADIIFVKINAASGIQHSANLLLIAGLVIAMLIFFVFRDKPGTKKSRELNKQDTQDVSHIFDKLGKIFRSKQIWLIGLVGCLFYLPASVVGDVWGIPYLETVYHFNQETAGYLISTLFLGWVLAGPFLGAWSDRIHLRCMPMTVTIAINAIALSLIVVLPIVHILPSLSLLYVLFFIVGASAGTHPLVFALAKENFPDRIAGTVVAVINTLTMLGGLVFQPIVGLILDWSHGTLGVKGAVVQYAPSDFSKAMLVIPVCLILCLFAMSFIKETHANEQ